VQVVGLSVSLLIAVIGAGLLFWWFAHRPAWLQLDPVRQLTFNGRTQFASISPDGKYLAYTVGQPDGEQALYLKQINSTADEIKIPPRPVSYKGLTFFPDSQTLYLVEKDNDAGVGRLYELPVIGQRAGVPVLVHIDGPVSFSPSGEEMAYVDVETAPHKLMISSRDGQRKRVLLAVSDAIMLLRPAWSADGKSIAVILFRDRPNSTGEAILDLVKLDGTESRRVIPDWQRIGHLRWTPDSKSILTDVGTYSDPNRTRIHQLAVATGVDQVLTNDLASYRYVSLTATGALLTAIKKDARAILWISRPKDLSHGQITPAQAEFDPSLSWIDDGHLVLDSRRNGFPNLALLDIANQSFAALTNEQHAEQAAAAIPGTGGKSIVFASNRSGEFHIWRFDSDANRYQQLTFGSSYDEQPSISPDGRWLVYTSWSDGTPHVMKVPATGGQPQSVLSLAAKNPQVSPDGKWVACYLQDPSSGKALAIAPLEGSAPPRLLPALGVPFRWSPDGASLSVVRTGGSGVSNVWNVPLQEGGAPSQLTDFDDQAIIGLAWSPSGDRLACLRETIGSDVALFKTGKGR
jgi:Tol biopolymer transport system component